MGNLERCNACGRTFNKSVLQRCPACQSPDSTPVDQPTATPTSAGPEGGASRSPQVGRSGRGSPAATSASSQVAWKVHRLGGYVVLFAYVTVICSIVVAIVLALVGISVARSSPLVLLAFLLGGLFVLLVGIVQGVFLALVGRYAQMRTGES